MNILDNALKRAGGQSNLARALTVNPNVVGNWQLRDNIPKPWRMVLEMMYPVPSRKTKPKAKAKAK